MLRAKIAGTGTTAIPSTLPWLNQLTLKGRHLAHEAGGSVTVRDKGVHAQRFHQQILIARYVVLATNVSVGYAAR